jgi:hypothetical protein
LVPTATLEALLGSEHKLSFSRVAFLNYWLGLANLSLDAPSLSRKQLEQLVKLVMQSVTPSLWLLDHWRHPTPRRDAIDRFTRRLLMQ